MFVFSLNLSKVALFLLCCLTHKYFQLSWLIVTYSDSLAFTVSFDRSKYSLCPGTEALSTTLTFLTFFYFALEFTKCIHTFMLPQSSTQLSPEAGFQAESSFWCPNRLWEILTFIFNPTSILAAITWICTHIPPLWSVHNNVKFYYHLFYSLSTMLVLFQVLFERLRKCFSSSEQSSPPI